VAKKKDIIIIKIRKKALVEGPEQWIPANLCLEAKYFAYKFIPTNYPNKFILLTFKDSRT